MGYDRCDGCDEPWCSGKTFEQTIECLERLISKAIKEAKVDEAKKWKISLMKEWQREIEDLQKDIDKLKRKKDESLNKFANL